MFDSWRPYQQNEKWPWDLERVVHLHRRVGFSATWSEVQRDLKDGPAASIARLLEGKSHTEGSPADFANVADTIGDSAVRSNNAGQLKAWWMYRMAFSPDPLGEKLTLLWHNHFATSNLKINDVSTMREQNEVFRKYARGSFANMLNAVVRHPAMLVWLDADSNRQEHPNENLARELLELFTLGIGNYTEDEVKEAARALTGWTVRKGVFYNNSLVHDAGRKKLFGQEDDWDGDDLVRLLLSHRATPRRLAWRLCQDFMGEKVVNDKALEELASGLAEHNLDIGWAVAAIVRSELFFSQENMASRVSSPVEFVINAVRTLEIFKPPPSTLRLADWAAKMGQELFYPPNVGGWSGGKDWLSGQYVIARANFTTDLTQGMSRAGTKLIDLCERHGRKPTASEFVQWLEAVLYGRTIEEDIRTRLVSAVEKTDMPLDQQLRLLAGLFLSLPQSQCS